MFFFLIKQGDGITQDVYQNSSKGQSSELDEKNLSDELDNLSLERELLKSPDSSTPKDGENVDNNSLC